MNFPNRRLQLLGWALCLGAFLLTGCSTQEVQQGKIENDLRYGALPKAEIGDTKQARIWADRAIAVDPTDPNTFVLHPKASGPDITIAQVFQQTGDDATLVDYLKQGAAKFPKDVWILAPLAEAQARLGDTAGQKATAARIVTLLESKVGTPGRTPDQDTMTMLGQAYWDSGNPVKGAETFRRLITLYPREIEPLNRLAYAYAVYDSKPNLPEALTDAKRALALAQGKGNSDEYISAIQDKLGWVQYRMGDYQSALINLQQASEANPREAESRYHLGMVYKAQGNTEAARVELTHATLLSKGYAAASRELEMLSKAPAAPPTAKPASG
ncbi:MAG: tetratricopeptide repeat protein [Armatimonadota bacterium]|nr:tetratricopeptide repeat protein [Armatimonadota bacterium]